MKARSLIMMLGLLLLFSGLSRNSSAQTATLPVLRVRLPYAAHVSIPRDVLLARGWSDSSLEHLRVRRQGQLIAHELGTNALSFRAEANESPFSSEAVYWLSEERDPAAGESPRIPAADQALAWEPDTLYSSVAQSARQDGWFAAELRSDSKPLHIALTLPEPLPSGSKLNLALATLIDTSHSLRISFNGLVAQPLHWQSEILNTHMYSIPTPSALPAGPLKLELALISLEEDAVLLDGISLPDARLPLPQLTVTQLETGQSLLDAPADTLIIAPQSMLAAARPLVAAHEALGQRVVLLDVQAAYDSYSFGEQNPHAIRSMIRNWQARPQRVILLGDGSLRMRDPAYGPDVSIPPFVVNADPKNGAVPCDSCYVRVDRDDPLDDPMPDMIIGRLPAHSPAEAAILVEKSVQALLTPAAGQWSNQALVVVDNDQDELGYADPAGPFTPLAAHSASLLERMQLQQFAYAPGQAANGQGYYATAATLRQALFPAWNAGAGLIIYIGHASPWQWAWTSPQEATPHLFNLYDAELLTNGRRLPILLSLSCQSGNSFHPELPTTDERLLLRAEGGIIAALSPAGSAVIAGHSRLSDAVLPALEHGASLGDAHLSGIASLIRSGRDLDLVFSYNLLGDPDVRLPHPTDVRVFLPLVLR